MPWWGHESGCQNYAATNCAIVWRYHNSDLNFINPTMIQPHQKIINTRYITQFLTIICFEHGLTTSALGDILLSKYPGLMAALNLCCAVQSFVGQDSGSLGWMCKGYTFRVERKAVKICSLFWVWRAQSTPSWKQTGRSSEFKLLGMQPNGFFWEGPCRRKHTGSASITVNSRHLGRSTSSGPQRRFVEPAQCHQDRLLSVN